MANDKKPDFHTTTIRQCFSTGHGQKTLAWMLREAGYFDDDLKTSEEQAVLNFVKMIVKNMGITNTIESSEEFVRKLFELKSF